MEQSFLRNNSRWITQEYSTVNGTEPKDSLLCNYGCCLHIYTCIHAKDISNYFISGRGYLSRLWIWIIFFFDVIQDEKNSLCHFMFFVVVAIFECQNISTVSLKYRNSIFILKKLSSSSATITFFYWIFLRLFLLRKFFLLWFVPPSDSCRP